MKWKNVPFGSLYQQPSRNGLSKPSRVRGSGVKMVNMGELFAHDRIFDIPMELVPVTEKELSASSLEQEDLLFARQSLVVEGAGKCSIVKEITEPTVFESHLIRVRLDSAKAIPEFYYYYFKSPLSPIKSIVSQCAQAGIKATDLAALSVSYPPLSVQKKIADTLALYDSLIENNRKQIKLLEEAAQRLYKEWFVDLRFPGHEHTPIINGIPQGWQRHIFADLIQKEIGGGWGKECEEGRYDVSAYVIRGTDIEHVSVGEYEVPYRYHTRTNFDARKLRNGDIIFEVSGGGKNEGVAKTLRVTSGMLGMWEERAICASFCKLVRLQDDVHSCYISDALKYLRATKQTESYENRSASSIINFRWADFLNNQEFIIPEKNTMLRYYEMSNAVYEKQVALARSISCATEARDRLLPKLMSGEVEV